MPEGWDKGPPPPLDLGGIRVHELDGGSLRFWLPTRRGVPEIRLRIRPALLVGSEGACLIDPGFGPADPRRREKFALEDPNEPIEAQCRRILGGDPAVVAATHLHFDHACGLLAAEAKGGEALRFPEAEILLHRIEWETGLRSGRGGRLAHRLEAALERGGGRMRLLEGETGEVWPGLDFRLRPGHTEGLLVFRAAGDRLSCRFPSDLCPTRAFLSPRGDPRSDGDEERALASRKALSEEMEAAGGLMWLYHDPDLPWIRRLQATGRGNGD